MKYTDKSQVGRISWSIFFIAFILSTFSWGSTSMTTFRYEGKFQGPGITPGTMTNQTISVSVKRPDNCGTTLGLTTWTSSSVTFEDGAFSISPSFDSALFKAAMNPWNSFGASCPVEFDRQIELTWNGETFVINLEDAPRSNLASYAVNASNTLAIGGVTVKSGMACATNEVLKYSTVNSQLECLPLATSDVPTLTVSHIPTLAGDLSGTVSAAAVTGIRGVSVSATAPTNGQILKYNGTDWSPAADAGGSVMLDEFGATSPSVQVLNLTTSGLLLSGGYLQLPNNIAANVYGDASNIPRLQLSAKGVVTSVITQAVNDTTKVPLAGGTMTGNLNMGSSNIISVGMLGVGTATPANALEVVGSGYFTGNALVGGVVSTNNLQVNGNTTTNLVSCQNTSAFTSVSSVTATCNGVLSASACNCQWHLASPPNAIVGIVPSAGFVSIHFLNPSSGSPGNIRCICHND